MFKFLNKPYPFNDDLKHNAKVIFFISIGVLIFLILFQPFNLESIPNEKKFYLISAIVIVTFLGLTLNLMIVPSIIPKLFINTNWNVKKEILWNLWLLFTITSGNILYYNYLGLLEFDLVLILKIILYGVVPISVLITINQERLLRYNLKTALELNKKLQEKKLIQEKMVFFESDYMKDSLSIKVSSILFVRLANNYIEVCWKEGEKVTSQMIRSSLKKAEEVLEDYKFIYKCHRSYIININNIEKVIGSYQGYKLYINNIETPIPVSQQYITRFKEMF